MITIKAFQIADYINVKAFRTEYVGEAYDYSSSEVYYVNDNNTYFYVLSYGVVVFANYNELKISEKIDFIKNYTKKPLTEFIMDEFFIHENSEQDVFGYNEAKLSKFSPEILKIVMLNIGQSVALDYYQQLTSHMLEETNRYTTNLEYKGRLSISTKKLLKLIGHTLNVKNEIIDQLYVIEPPEETWNDEYLAKVDSGIRHIFDIKIRFKNIDDNLKIVKDNLELFKDLMQHKKSNLLEIIIILLILVEVINVFLEKFL